MECDGECAFENRCTGEIQRVHVIDKVKDWGYFDYCETAINRDRSKGMKVLVLDQEKEAADD